MRVLEHLAAAAGQGAKQFLPHATSFYVEENLYNQLHPHLSHFWRRPPGTSPISPRIRGFGLGREVLKFKSRGVVTPYEPHQNGCQTNTLRRRPH
jgi:hypothetical protein